LANTSYDLNGNLLADTFHSYTWDSEGNPATIDSIGLTYDAFDRVVEQNQSGTYYQIVYTPLGKKLGLFSAQSGKQVIQQVYVPLPGGTSAEYLSSGLSHYRHADWLGSDRIETDASNHSVKDSNAYAPFGEPYAQVGNGEISFTGQNKDTDWLQYDFLFRQYDPKQGRWISPDRAGLTASDPTNPQSWNRYGYVMNNPLALMDPVGLCPDYDSTYIDAAGNPVYVSDTGPCSPDPNPGSRPCPGSTGWYTFNYGGVTYFACYSGGQVPSIPGCVQSGYCGPQGGGGNSGATPVASAVTPPQRLSFRCFTQGVGAGLMAAASDFFSPPGADPLDGVKEVADNKNVQRAAVLVAYQADTALRLAVPALEIGADFIPVVGEAVLAYQVGKSAVEGGKAWKEAVDHCQGW